MSKIKEIALNLDTSRVSSPHVKGKQPYYSGYSGGMTDSAASAISTLNNTRKVDVDFFEEESEEEIDLMPENILSKRVRRHDGYSLNETLMLINENVPADAMEILEEMEDLHKNMISDLINCIQSVAQIISPPGTGPMVASAELVGGQVVQFAGGNFISELGKLIASTRTSDRSSVVKVISHLAPFLAALPSGIMAPFVGMLNKIFIDSIECIGNLAAVLDKSPTSKDSLYRIDVGDVVFEVLGDIPFSAVDSVDDLAMDIPSAILSGARLAFNLGQLWFRTSKANNLIEEYENKFDPLARKRPTSTGKFNLSDRAGEAQDYFQRNSSQIEKMVDSYVSQAMQGSGTGPVSESFKLIDLIETAHYDIDEDPEEEDLLGGLDSKQSSRKLEQDEDTVGEASGAAAGGASALPLGMSTKSASGKHSSTSGGKAYPYSKKSQSDFAKYSKRTLGNVTENVVSNQRWNHKTLGQIKYR